MNENTDLLPNLSSQEDAFEVQMRGYSRRQVDDFVARCRSQIRELEERLGRALDEGEQLRHRHPRAVPPRPERRARRDEADADDEECIYVVRR